MVVESLTVANEVGEGLPDGERWHVRHGDGVYAESSRENAMQRAVFLAIGIEAAGGTVTIDAWDSDSHAMLRVYPNAEFARTHERLFPALLDMERGR